MRTLSLAICRLAAGAMLACSTSAQSDLEASKISGQFGLDLTTHYFFRGIVQENQNLIAQPWIELGLPLSDGDSEGDGALELSMGLWNSLHRGPTGIDGGRSAWYESDFYVGAAADIGSGWTLGAVYTAYTSPNSVFGTIQELGFQAAFDDAELYEGFGGLQPSVTVAFEFDRQADGGSDEGIYLQFAVEPSIEPFEEQPITLALPVTLGLSLYDYYEDANGDDDFFGFFDVGLVGSMPLEFMPSRAGPWEASLGLHLLFLGDNMKTLNSGDGFEAILSFGVSTSF